MVEIVCQSYKYMIFLISPKLVNIPLAPFKGGVGPLLCLHGVIHVERLRRYLRLFFYNLTLNFIQGWFGLLFYHFPHYFSCFGGEDY